jgi:hypothetical protein
MVRTVLRLQRTARRTSTSLPIGLDGNPSHAMRGALTSGVNGIAGPICAGWRTFLSSRPASRRCGSFRISWRRCTPRSHHPWQARRPPALARVVEQFHPLGISRRLWLPQLTSHGTRGGSPPSTRCRWSRARHCEDLFPIGWTGGGSWGGAGGQCPRNGSTGARRQPADALRCATGRRRARGRGAADRAGLRAASCRPWQRASRWRPASGKGGRWAARRPPAIWGMRV